MKKSPSGQTEFKHVLVLSYPVFGHIIPHIELAKRISDQGCPVTFVVSAVRLEQIRSRQLIPADYAAKIVLVGLQDDVAENADQIVSPTAREETANSMRDGLTDFFSNLSVTGQDPPRGSSKCPVLRPVDMVVSDLFCHQAVQICHQRRIPCHIFSVTSALGLSTMLNIAEDAPTVSNEVFYSTVKPLSNAKENGGRQLSDSNKRFMLACNNVIHLAHSVIVNSFSTLEPAALTDLQTNPKSASVPVLMIGPLLSTESISESNAATHRYIKAWLDAKENGTVVYVAFGSMGTFTRELTQQIALALLHLGKPVIWSLSNEQRKNLPPAFLEILQRDEGNVIGQFLVEPWIPQRTVLGHAAIRVFVTHTGWNSAIESISSGVPMVFWPLSGDENVNSDWLAREKLGIRVPGTGLRSTRIVSADEFKRTVSAVAGWENDGTDYLGNSRMWAERASNAWTVGGDSHRQFLHLKLT